jgi:hypothetical protein
MITVSLMQKPAHGRPATSPGSHSHPAIDRVSTERSIASQTDIAALVARGALQVGLIAVVLVALPYKLFELDRYFVPKELVLHGVALVVGLALFLRWRTLRLDLVDLLLLFFLGWSTLSALFVANHWVAQRALGLSVSSAIIFWGARHVAVTGSYRPLLVTAAIASACVAGTSLLQAYGLDSAFFSLNRAPGGTLGNRNFIAHLAAIGLPVMIWVALTTRTPVTTALSAFGTALLSAALVMSRSRAAWLAVATTILIVAIPALAARKYASDGRIGGRLVRLLLAIGLGGLAALILPNRLNWKSDSPYLDSAKGMIDYKQGSGQGRVAQYRNTLAMTADHPVFGVGPGNWPVRYPTYAPENDRSLADDGMTANPWPSSDWRSGDPLPRWRCLLPSSCCSSGRSDGGETCQMAIMCSPRLLSRERSPRQWS